MVLAVGLPKGRRTKRSEETIRAGHFGFYDFLLFLQTTFKLIIQIGEA